jgi:valyl-tRNA synthetase
MDNMQLADKWILSELQNVKKEIEKHYKKSDFAMVARVGYEFIWSKYCDWYLELVKTRLYSESKAEKETAFSVLVFVLREILSLMNPIMPFITEEINENINKILNLENKSLAVVDFPKYDEKLVNKNIENEMAEVIEIISKIRNIRAEMNVAISKEIELMIKYSGNNKNLDDEKLKYIQKLTKATKITQGENIEKPAKSVVSITENYEIYIPLSGLVDLEKEKERLTKELTNLKAELQKINQKLENKNFVDRAPAEEVEKVSEKGKIILEKICKIEQNLKELE